MENEHTATRKTLEVMHRQDRRSILSVVGGRSIATAVQDEQETAAELVKRWNAHHELLEALADMVATASVVENIMDGDRDKQDAWSEELGRLYVAIDEAKAAIAKATGQQ